MYQVKSPILFLIFNRPEETSKVFNEIKKAKPSKLYIAADGPRPLVQDDVLLCKKTLDIVNSVDWDCEIKTLFRKENLGCRVAVSGAISWFFEEEPEGIVLEDDCLPSEDFFYFADEMLAYYRYNEKIAHICGCNFQNGIKRNEYSYYYSNITHVWGWAGWRRVWQNYDVNINWLNDGIKNNFLNVLTESKLKKLFLELTLKKVKMGEINTWDYQYGFLNTFNNMISVIPNNNMISNIGFNKNGTHTTSLSHASNVHFEKLQTPITHPPILLADKKADEYTLCKDIPSALRVIWSLIKFNVKNILGLNK